MKTLFICIFLTVTALSYSQAFEFSKTDSVELSKEKIFSRTKSFIADYYNSGKTVTQNEDKDAGIIQLVAKFEKAINVGLLGMKLYDVYTYQYAVKFRMKDYKFRIEIYDVICKSAIQTGLNTTGNIPIIQPFMGEPDTKTSSFGKGLTKKQAIKMMNDISEDFKSLIIKYITYIKSNKNDDF